MFSGTFAAEVLCPLYLIADKNEFDFGRISIAMKLFSTHNFEYVNFADARIVNIMLNEKSSPTLICMLITPKQVSKKELTTL